MDNNYYKGQLTHWNETKGFGFIGGGQGEKDIFIHISALKYMSRPPVVGDMILYQKEVDHNGKTRAINAKIKGVAAFKPAVKKVKKSRHDRRYSGARFDWISPVLLVAAGFFLYSHFNKEVEGEDILEPSSNITTVSDQGYEESIQCEGKVYCSEMTSCEEAKFYLRHCPGTKMDGDRDGIPCESQWCSW